MGLALEPETMTIVYDAANDTINITTNATGRQTFNELGFIKFLDKRTEPNICDAEVFNYNWKQVDKNDTDFVYNLTSNKQPGVIKDLVAHFKLLDDDGTVVFNLTTVDDYYSGNKKKFRAPNVQNYAHFKREKRVLGEFLVP